MSKENISNLTPTNTSVTAAKRQPKRSQRKASEVGKLQAVVAASRAEVLYFTQERNGTHLSFHQKRDAEKRQRRLNALYGLHDTVLTIRNS